MSAAATDGERRRRRRVGLAVMVVVTVAVGGLHVRRTQQRGGRALNAGFVALARMAAAHAAGDRALRERQRSDACRAFRRAGAPWGIGPLVALGLDLCERWPAAFRGDVPPAPDVTDAAGVEAALRYARGCLLVAKPADALPVLSTVAARRDHALRVYRLFAERWVNAGAPAMAPAAAAPR